MVDILGSGGGGKGGGGSARTPVESPDNLHSTAYALVLDAISNGEVEGPAHLDVLQDIYLDGTPIRNSDGSLNFSDVQVEVRAGTQGQDHIPGFPASSSVNAVNVEVKEDTPWAQAITNPDLDALRVTLRWPSLVKTVTSGSKVGDRIGTKVDYAIDISTDGGSFVNVITANVNGKGHGYERTHRIELPEGSSWTVRVRRLTADSTSGYLENAMWVSSYAEVIDGKFRYPNTAIVGIKIDAAQFSSIPTRAFHWRGIRIRVPNNYNPESRTYTGVWDGTFKRAWSNNPAWIFYDLLTSTLYGLGDRIDASMIDRYALYQIGAYCDQSVSDGQGGTEPRFVCNAYLQAKADALRVLNDLASTFRGMAYWANGQVVGVADMPSDPVYTYANANVIDGRFEYTGADLNTRKTVALVSWNDPSDFYRSKVEVVNDDDGIRRYGVRKTEVKAFGATTRGQAQRVGLYQLYTARMETGGVVFSVGLDGVIPRPGDVIKIADANRAGRRIGGRIKFATNSIIILDKGSGIKVGDTLTVNMPDGQAQSRIVQAFGGQLWDDAELWDLYNTWDGENSDILKLDQPFDAAPSKDAIWAIDSDDLVTQPARVISVAEGDGITFDISAVFHHPDKFSAIDNGIRLDPLPVSVVPPRTQLAPTNVAITEFITYHQDTTRHLAEITWDKPEYAVHFDVQWRRDDSDWVQMPRTGLTIVTLDDIFAGDYIVRVRAVNALDVPSLWSYSDLTTLDGIVDAPATPTHLVATGEIMAIRLDWGYPAGPSIISRIEIRASLTNDFDDSYPLTEIAYPTTAFTVYGLGYSTELWFWARLIDKNGTQGAWYPTGVGVYGQPDQDPENLLEYLEGRIGEGQLANGLVDEIQAGAADRTLDDIIGDLSGDDVDDAVWFAGDDDSHFVGSVTTTSVINYGDYLEAKRTASIAAEMEGSLAVIRQTMDVQTSATAALATEIDELAIKVGEGAEAAIEEVLEVMGELEGDLSATWGIKTQVRQDGKVVQAGVSLGASIGRDDTSRSEFLVMADTVAFLNSLNGTLHSPFVFDVQNDTAFLNTVFIQNASISFAKIQNDLQSSNYVAGASGWKIDKNGNFEINGSGGSGRLTITNNLVRVYDENDTLRVRMGIW